MSDSNVPAWASALVETMNTFRTETAARFDAIERRLDEQADRIVGAIALASAADATGAGAETASLERDLARSRAMAALSQAVGAMQSQIDRLSAQVESLRQGRAS